MDCRAPWFSVETRLCVVREQCAVSYRYPVCVPEKILSGEFVKLMHSREALDATCAIDLQCDRTMVFAWHSASSASLHWTRRNKMQAQSTSAITPHT